MIIQIALVTYAKWHKGKQEQYKYNYIEESNSKVHSMIFI